VKRIGRYIRSALTVLSLVLCVATIGLWVRSYRVRDAFVWRYIPRDMSYGEQIWFATSRGGLSFERVGSAGIPADHFSTPAETFGYLCRACRPIAASSAPAARFYARKPDA
jgi:hypothetical protein